MGKLTAALVIIVGLLLLLKELDVLEVITNYNGWVISIAVLIIGIVKLIKSFRE